MIHLLFAIILLASAAIDAAARRIPNIFPLLIAVLAICRILHEPTNIASHITGLFVPAILMLLLTAHRGGLGGGDIKLTGACGLFLGTDAVLAGCFLASLMALTVYFVRRLYRNLRQPAHKQHPQAQGSSFAFGPYLAAGFIVAAFF